MTVTFQESVDALLSGRTLSWDKGGSATGGTITLDEAHARRLFEFLIGQNQDLVAKADETLFDGLVEAWDNAEHDPKDQAVEQQASDIVSGFRLAGIETEGFGGLNVFDGPVFQLDVARQSWCLEGQNGSGKTSLASAIIWALTGRRIIEHMGPEPDSGERQPVMDTAGTKIGDWPPLASYPTKPEDLKNDARVRVKLTFRNPQEEEALAERVIVSKADGTVGVEKADVDARLLSAPQLLDSGLLMPARMANLGFGDRSPTLYEAVKSLTGLDRLGAVGDGATNFSNGQKKFKKYSKYKGVDRIENDYARHYSKAMEEGKAVDVDLSAAQSIQADKLVETLKALIEELEQTASGHAETLKTMVSEDIDVTTPAGRKKVSEAIGAAKEVLKNATAKVPAFSLLTELRKAKEEGGLDGVPTALDTAEEDLKTALHWHAEQQADEKLRLKAVAAQFYDAPQSAGIYARAFSDHPESLGDSQGC